MSSTELAALDDLLGFLARATWASLALVSLAGFRSAPRCEWSFVAALCWIPAMCGLLLLIFGHESEFVLYCGNWSYVLVIFVASGLGRLIESISMLLRAALMLLMGVAALLQIASAYRLEGAIQESARRVLLERTYAGTEPHT